MWRKGDISIVFCCLLLPVDPETVISKQNLHSVEESFASFS